MRVVRLNDDGTLDTSFGTDGIVAIDFFGGFDEASDVVIQPDGKILVVGELSEGLNRRVALVRVVP